MANKMLVDASHPEETRVVVLRGNKVEEFDFESATRKQIRGNIYLAKVIRVEPSLQAAFVEYGGNRHGFLSFSEIHPDYYQIPAADRKELYEQVLEESESETNESVVSKENFEESATSPVRTEIQEEVVVNKDAPESIASNIHPEQSEPDPEFGENETQIESIGTEDAFEEVPIRKLQPRKNYKIQDVIKRRQIILVQVLKEERGTKGVALTTYISLAGRFSVLMPNSARGGGVSRKIGSANDRKRLKQIAAEFEVPEGMGVIIRTAGASRTKAEIRRDYEYLMRLWEQIRDFTLKSTAPCLIFEEGSLIKRSIRDLYGKDISKVIVSGENGFRDAKEFMNMLMPSHVKNVQQYTGSSPIFVKHAVESQLESMFSSTVKLKSGGYIVINQTEALVSIDVNSGKATREHNIEDTAVATNLEASEEISRQLRLRDLAGLIVIDFIDMEDKKNDRIIEKRLKECLSSDRARIQMGRISPFGLFEMSRQRLRTGILESSTVVCDHCSGTGIMRSTESVALFVLRELEGDLLKKSTHDLTLKTSTDVAIYILNQKREYIADLEKRFGVNLLIVGDESIHPEIYSVVRDSPSSRKKGEPVTRIQPDMADLITESVAGEDSEETSGKKRKRRRRKKRIESNGSTNSDGTENSVGVESNSTGSIGTPTVTEKTGNEPGTNGRRRWRQRVRHGKRQTENPQFTEVKSTQDNQVNEPKATVSSENVDANRNLSDDEKNTEPAGHATSIAASNLESNISIDSGNESPVTETGMQSQNSNESGTTTGKRRPWWQLKSG